MSATSNVPSRRLAAGSAGVNPHAPSTLLPLPFIITGLLAWVGGIAAVVIRPAMLATYHYNQYVISVTHLLVLGWICTVVMGAMYQLVPVALETRLYSERLARWQFALHVVGFSGMVWMFWTWNLKHVGHFGTVLTVGVGLFVYNLVRTLLRVRRWNVVSSAVACALGWISLAVLAGLAIVVGKCSYDADVTLSPANPVGPLLRGLRAAAALPAHFDAISAMHAHAHLGSIGLFLMLMVGISYKLVPMFTLSEVQSPRRAGASLVLLNAGLAGSFVAILLQSRLKPVFAAVVIAGLALYGCEMAAILRARKRRVLDWGVKQFLAAMALLAPLSLLALLLSWPTLPLTTLTGQFENLYGFLGLLGVISLGIGGMLYKIIPFLIWYRAYSQQVGRCKVPALADLYSPRLQAAGFWIYLAGLAVTSVGIVLGNAIIVRCGATVLGLSLATQAINVITMLGHLFRPAARPLPASPGPLATVTQPI
ncbi:MAG TPA: cbb3-type cytochrome c oxidase subunit I [Candidatus Acidoferrum sp.]|nr:cbb3-type cytochrome c oxidase subunit I [Candidatus Acidoferrum sp.]